MTSNPITRVELMTPKTADYAEVQSKATSIFRSGGVDPISVTPTYSQAEVTSTSGQVYLNLLEFPSGDSDQD